MTVDSVRLKAAFRGASEAREAGAREAILDREYPGDSELRRCVEELLRVECSTDPGNETTDQFVRYSPGDSA